MFAINFRLNCNIQTCSPCYLYYFSLANIYPLTFTVIDIWHIPSKVTYSPILFSALCSCALSSPQLKQKLFFSFIQFVWQYICYYYITSRSHEWYMNLSTCIISPPQCIYNTYFLYVYHVSYMLLAAYIFTTDLLYFHLYSYNIFIYLL